MIESVWDFRHGSPPLCRPTNRARLLTSAIFIDRACWSESETLARCHCCARLPVTQCTHCTTHARSEIACEPSPHISIQLDTSCNHTDDFLLTACENMRFHRETQQYDDTFRFIRRKIKNSKNRCATSQWPLLLFENTVEGKPTKKSFAFFKTILFKTNSASVFVEFKISHILKEIWKTLIQ